MAAGASRPVLPLARVCLRRPKRQPKPSSDEGYWDCSVCTFRNSAEAFKCLMCDVRKGTSTRWVAGGGGAGAAGERLCGGDRNWGRGSAVHPQGVREGGRDRNRVSFIRGGGGNTQPPPARGSSVNLTQRCAGVCRNRNNKCREGQKCLHSLTLERWCPSDEEKLSPRVCLLRHLPFQFLKKKN